MIFKKKSIGYFLFFIFGLMSVFVYTEVISSGKISDAKNYFEFYENILENGYINFLVAQFNSSGKLEPGIYFVYSLFPSGLEFKKFVFLNYLIFLMILFFIFKTVLKYKDNNYIKTAFIFIVLIFFWYPMYSNLLWIWRNIFAVLFLIISIFSLYKFSRVMVLIAISFHYSALMYYLLLAIVRRFFYFIKKLSALNFILLHIMIGVILGLGVHIFFNYFEFLFAGFKEPGNSDWRNFGGVNYVGGIISIYLFVLLIPFITIYSRIAGNKRNIYIYIYMVLLIASSFSLLFYESHFIAHRIFVFSSFLYVPFYLLFKEYLALRLRMVTGFLIFLGVLPTLNSMFKYMFN
jgi:hypothetical protein